MKASNTSCKLDNKAISNLYCSKKLLNPIRKLDSPKVLHIFSNIKGDL